MSDRPKETTAGILAVWIAALALLVSMIVSRSELGSFIFGATKEPGMVEVLPKPRSQKAPETRARKLGRDPLSGAELPIATAGDVDDYLGQWCVADEGWEHIRTSIQLVDDNYFMNFWPVDNKSIGLTFTSKPPLIAGNALMFQLKETVRGADKPSPLESKNIFIVAVIDKDLRTGSFYGRGKEHLDTPNNDEVWNVRRC